MTANTVTVESTPNTVVSTPVITRVTTAKTDVSVSTPDETVTLSLDLLEATVSLTEAPVSVMVDNPALSVLTVGIQGPPGVVEEEIVYAKRVDFSADGSYLYRAEAVPGTAESANVWRIRRIDIAQSDGDVTETWAEGNALFNKVWDDRLTYTYS